MIPAWKWTPWAARPGVYSARYADDLPSLPGESRDARNMRKLLQELAGVPEARRTGRYVCCMTAVTPAGQSLATRGVWEGRLLAEQRGHNGFGYDPLFFDPTLGLTAAQMTPEQKNARSHRGQGPARPVGPLGRLCPELTPPTDTRNSGASPPHFCAVRREYCSKTMLLP